MTQKTKYIHFHTNWTNKYTNIAPKHRNRLIVSTRWLYCMRCRKWNSNFIIFLLKEIVNFVSRHESEQISHCSAVTHSRSLTRTQCLSHIEHLEDTFIIHSTLSTDLHVICVYCLQSLDQMNWFRMNETRSRTKDHQPPISVNSRFTLACSIRLYLSLCLSLSSRFAYKIRDATRITLFCHLWNCSRESKITRVKYLSHITKLQRRISTSRSCFTLQVTTFHPFSASQNDLPSNYVWSMDICCRLVTTCVYSKCEQILWSRGILSRLHFSREKHKHMWTLKSE